jgi:hypothetical protein
VVSLKEGMFNNANVIFCTKFVDGASTVTRTVPSRHTGSLKCQNRLEQTCHCFLQSSHSPNVVLACNL